MTLQAGAQDASRQPQAQETDLESGERMQLRGGGIIMDLCACFICCEACKGCCEAIDDCCCC